MCPIPEPPETARSDAPPEPATSAPETVAAPAAAASVRPVCPNCGARPDDPVARFCPYDGALLAVPGPSPPAACPSCGRAAAAGEKFCPADGAPLAAAAAGPGRFERAGGFFDRAGRKVDALAKTGYAVHIGRYLGRAWDYFKDYPLGYLGFGAIMSLTALTVVGLLLIYPMAAGVSWVARKQRRGEPAKFSDFFHGFNRFGPLFIGGLLAVLFMALGLFTCGILTVYLAVGYLFFAELVLFKGMDFGEALEASRKVIHQQWFEMFVFFLVLTLVAAGVIALTSGFAAVFVLPFLLLAIHAAYEEIVGYD